MGIYVKPNKEKEYVWLVWVFQNFEVNGVRTLNSVHSTQASAHKAEGLLPRDEYQYYSIEKKELQ